MKTFLKKINLVNHKIYYLGTITILLWLVYYIWKTGVDLTYNLSDITFHLSTSAGFARSGGIVTWDFWESLPLGRAHNYPPLFHTIFANFLKLGLSPANTAKLMMEFTIVGGFLVYIWGIVKLFNIKIAFWSFWLSVSSLYFIHLSATVMPATLVLFLVPALFYSMRQRKWLSYTIILIFMFYLHLFLPYIILFGFFVYLLMFEKELFRSWFKATSVAFLCYLPWFANVLLCGFDYIKYFNSSYSLHDLKKLPYINTAVYFLAIAGFFFFLQKGKKRTKSEEFIWIMTITFFGLSLFMTNRIGNGNLLLLASLPAAMTITRPYKKNILKIGFFLLALSCGFSTLYVFAHGFRSTILVKRSSFFEAAFPTKVTLFPERDYVNISKIIGKETEPGDSIISMVSIYKDPPTNTSSQKSVSNYWAVPNKLTTLNLRQPEIYNRPFPDIIKAKVLITSTALADIDANLLRQYSYVSDDETLFRIHNDFLLLSDCEGVRGQTIYFYINKSSDTIKGSASKPKVPLALADVIIILLFILLLRDLNKPSEK